MISFGYCVQSMKDAYSTISHEVGVQEEADIRFERDAWRLNRSYSEPSDRMLAALIKQVASKKNPLSELKSIYKPIKFIKILIIKPLRAAMLSVIRATLFLGAPFQIAFGLFLSIYRHSFKDLTKSLGDTAKLIRLFIRGVLKIVPLVGPLLGRAWSVLNVAITLGATKIFDSVKPSELSRGEG